MALRSWPAWARASDIVDLLRLSGPIAVSRAAVMLMSITDAVVLGQNAPGELPFVLNSWLPIGVSLGLSMGLLLGVSVLTAELGGLGRERHSGRIFRRGLWFSVWFGALMTAVIFGCAPLIFSTLAFKGHVLHSTVSVTRILALGLVAHMVTHVGASYLEALRRPLIVTLILYSGVVLNFFADMIFVAGWFGMPKLGADGVAIATSSVRWLLAAVFLLACARLSPAFRPAPDGPPGESARQFRIGYGLAISNIAEWGSFNFTFVIATWISLAVNTVYGLATQTIGFCFMAFLGLGTATSVRVAECYGRGDGVGVRNASRLGVVAGLLLGVGLGVTMFVFRDVIAAVLLKGDAQVEGQMLRPALSALLALTALVIVWDGIQNVASMALRAQGVVWAPSVVHVGSYFLIMLPFAYGFGLVLGRAERGMMEGVLLASLVAGLLQMVLLELKIRSSSPFVFDRTPATLASAD